MKSIMVALSFDDKSKKWFAWSEQFGGVGGKGDTQDEALNKFKHALNYSLSFGSNKGLRYA
jgi:hypothetical protein